ncbi:MAG: TIGR00730 family Rossman fold protein [Lachnospiraceae bacterium]|nr:TIGR00730 family Rossman fold protein [Lachnospiraceae bacterium]
MKIAVYCGAAQGRNPAYLQAAKRLGEWIAANGHELVYGAGKVGMMGMIADTVLHAGGRVTGVIPDFMVELGWCHEHLTQCIVEESMSARKKRMCEMSDAMIALPGGAGTLEEITEVISWQRLGLNDRPCILFNVNGFYEPLRAMYLRTAEEDFLEREALDSVLFSDDPDEIGRFITGFKKRGRTAAGGY